MCRFRRGGDGGAGLAWRSWPGLEDDLEAEDHLEEEDQEEDLEAEDLEEEDHLEDTE